MMQSRSNRGPGSSSVSKPSSPEREHRKQLKETLMELRELLELYAPAWYPESLSKKAGSVLRSRLK